MKTWFEQNKQYMPIMVMIGLFTAMGLIAWFGIRPFHTFIKDKADAIQEYYAFRENRERQIKRLPDLEKQFEHILAQEQTIRILTPEDQIVGFVKTLERLGTESDVHVEIQARDSNGIVEVPKATRSARKENDKTEDESEVTPKKKEAPKIAESLPYERYLPISVVLIGEYENIVTFLYRMETLPYGLDVIGMKVKKREIDEIVTKPSSPGRNPFLILAQGETITTETEEEQAIPGSLEATIETAVYINKQSDL
ncbi:MAG: hypothetical protein E6Q53_00280 [Candidatus Moraniibacteriota bacterium]|nr:MAG: hypothetical protein E6Q53_00280 [Candidatus Moranbacteria bacterium]